MLIRILRNLLSNASRYTCSGRVLLALRARCDSLHIEVRDTGVGIEESKLKDIFTEFRQLLPQGTGGRQGAGLAIVERMVPVLGYRIDMAAALIAPLAMALFDEVKLSRPGLRLKERPVCSMATAKTH